MVCDINSIELEPDYEGLCFIISHLMHEVKRYGKDGFIDKYVSELESIKNKWKFQEYCFLLALIGYFNSDYIDIDSDVCMPKYILNPYDYEDMLDGIKLDLDSLYNNVDKSMKKRGFLFDAIDEAI